MTDEALAGGVDTSTEHTPAPEEQVAPPNPVETRAPVKEQPEQPEEKGEVEKPEEGEKPKKSLSEAIKAADEKARAKAAEKEAAEKAKPEPKEKPTDKAPKEEAKAEPARDESGKFTAKEKPEGEPTPEQAPKTETAFKEAPKRFDDAAKGEWESVPESVRGATHRTMRELEQGLDQYRQAYEPYKDFDARLKQNGQTFEEVLNHYTGIENMLREDPYRGLDTICRNMGTSLREVAEKIVGQTPDEARAQSDQTINDLRNKVGQLEQMLGQVTGAVQEQTHSQAVQQAAQQIDAFVAQPEHSRFEELAESIIAEIKAGYSLDEAYRRAELLNPAPQAPAQTRSETPIQPEAEVQTLKGSKSVSGAPRSGMTPAKAKSGPSSIREAIERAAARAG